MTTGSVDYCMFVNEWVSLRSRVCLLMLEMVVFETELGQK